MEMIVTTPEKLQEMILTALQNVSGANVPTISQPQTASDLGGLEVAREITGWTNSTIYTKCSRREIPHYKRGKSLFFDREELKQFIRNGRVSTRAEITAQIN